MPQTYRNAHSPANPKTNAKAVAMRGAERALGVLRALNDRNGSSVTALSAMTGISRPALYRILESLCIQGYIRKRSEGDRYELTALVRSLSHGYKDEDWLRQSAVPVIEELQEQVVWPTDLATFHDNAMYLRETTRGRSPMTIDGVAVGMRMPMLRSATGKAYLASCSPDERKLILANLRTSTHPDDAISNDAAFVRNLLSMTTRRGYGERQNDLVPKTSSIAIPLHHAGRVLACLNITFISSALTPAEAAHRYLAAMQAAGRRIEEQAARTGVVEPQPPTQLGNL